jgi:hypothetical protein
MDRSGGHGQGSGTKVAKQMCIPVFCLEPSEDGQAQSSTAQEGIVGGCSRISVVDLSLEELGSADGFVVPRVYHSHAVERKLCFLHVVCPLLLGRQHLLPTFRGTRVTVTQV